MEGAGSGPGSRSRGECREGSRVGCRGGCRRVLGWVDAWWVQGWVQGDPGVGGCMVGSGVGPRQGLRVRAGKSFSAQANIITPRKCVHLTQTGEKRIVCGQTPNLRTNSIQWKREHFSALPDTNSRACTNTTHTTHTHTTHTHTHTHTHKRTQSCWRPLGTQETMITYLHGGVFADRSVCSPSVMN